MVHRSTRGVILLVVAAVAVTVSAESYRFDDHLADAKQVTITPIAAWMGSMPLFSPEGPLAWRPSGDSAESQSWTEDGRFVLVTKNADRACSPKGRNLDMSQVGCLEIELCVTGQDTVQVERGLQADDRPCAISVPQQGQFFTARIDPRSQRGWLFPLTDQIMIGVKGAARLEIRAVRAVSPLFTVPVGVRTHKADHSSRRILFAHCPMTLEYTLRVPEHGLFAAGLTVSGKGQPVAFSVDIRSGGTTTPVLTRSVEDPDAWVDVEADLSAFAGQEVTMALSASCAVPGQVGMWSNPSVLERRAPGDRRLPNIVYYVVDALRADHLDAYGYALKTAPAVTAFAESGVRFNWCLSSATLTPVSAPSYHASVGSLVHKIIPLMGESVPPSLVTFPELLRSAGYTTGAVTENMLAPPNTGLRCSYGNVVDNPAYDKERPPTNKVAAQFIETNCDRPFFLYVHTVEVHDVAILTESPQTRYSAPPPFMGMFPPGPQWGCYDDCIAHASKNFDDFLQQLGALGLADNTIVIFSADHGEAFEEHDGLITHGGTPYIELIRVPLAIRWPGVLPAGKVFEEPVSLLDLPPTILDYAGIPVPAQFQGMSLRGLVEGARVSAFQERTVFSHGKRSSFGVTAENVVHNFATELMQRDPRSWRNMYENLYLDAFSAVKLPWALYRQYPDGPVHLYNLAADPSEKEDVAPANPEIVKAMGEQIDAYRRHEAELSAQLGTSSTDREDTFDNAQKEALQALGYLGR